MSATAVRPAVASRRRPLDLAWLGGGLLVLVASAVVASDGGVGPREEALFHAINELPDSLEPMMTSLQFLGVLVVGPIVALVALLLRRPRLSLAALSVTALKLAAERWVKALVERQRPGTSTPDAIVRDVPVRGLAFVSGHAVLVAGLAGVVSPYLRSWWKAIPWVVLFLVCVARVYLGAHNPLDVVGGAGLGVAIAGALNLVLGVPDRPVTASGGRG